MFWRVLNMPLTNCFISRSYTNIWVGKTEVSDVFSWRHIRVVAPLTSLNVCPIRQHTLRDMKSFKTNLSIIFKSLTLSSSSLFKDTENIFQFLVLSSSFCIFVQCWNFKHFEVCSSSIEIAINGWHNSNLLQFIF